MGRGRKPISSFQGSDWETVFYNSVGSYVQFINIELSKEYKLEPLSSHIKIIGGYAFKTAQYKKQGVPIIRISDFNNEQIILKDVVYYESAPNLEKFELVEGDIIIALTGGTIAKLAIVQPDLGKIYLNQRVGKFEVLHPEIFETEYIYWIARSVQSIIKNLAWGAAIPNVSPKQIEELQFPFPTKEVQKGIIAFLNDLKNNTVDEDRIYFNQHIENEIILLQEKQITTSLIATELNKQLNIIKQLRQASLREAMQGKLVKSLDTNETGYQLLQKIKTEKEKLIKDKTIKKGRDLLQITDNEIPFKIPEHWVWCKLGEVLTEIKYGTSQSCDYDFTKNSKVLRIPNISSGILNDDDLKYANLNLKEQKELALAENDILIIRSNGSRELVGKTVLVTPKFNGYAYAGYLVRFRFNAKLTNPKFLWFATTSNYFRQLIEIPLRTTVGINNINTEEMSNLLIPIPPIREQLDIVLQLEKLIIYYDKLELSIKESLDLNDKLLQKILRDMLGIKWVEEKETPNETKRAIKKIYFNSINTFTTLSMTIVEILKKASEPLPANVVWNSSEFSDDIELFYAELKKLVDVEKVVVEEKIGMESYLKLA